MGPGSRGGTGETRGSWGFGGVQGFMDPGTREEERVGQGFVEGWGFRGIHGAGDSGDGNGSSWGDGGSVGSGGF